MPFQKTYTVRQEIDLLTMQVDPVADFGIVTRQQQTNLKINRTTGNDGALEHYFEMVARNTHASDVGWIYLTYEQGGLETNLGLIQVPASQSAYIRQRQHITGLPSEANGMDCWLDRSVIFGANAVVGCRQSRVLVVLTGTTALTAKETLIELSSYPSGTNTATTIGALPKYWLYTAANWDGTLAFYASATIRSTVTMYSASAVLQQDDGNFSNWTDLVTIGSTSSANLTRVEAAFTPTDGRHYRIGGMVSNSKGTHVQLNGHIIVRQTNSPTKWEEYMGFINFNPSGTGLVDGDNYWDPAEWAGLKAKFYLEGTGKTANAAAKLQYDCGQGGTPTDLPGASISGINRQRSSQLTMPAGPTTLDVYAQSVDGDLMSGPRILAVCEIGGEFTGDAERWIPRMGPILAM